MRHKLVDDMEDWTVAVSETNRIDVVAIKEKEPTSLEGRIERLEAKETLRDLVMQYAHYTTNREVEKLLALFTDDVERVLLGSLTGITRGKPKMREWYNNPILPARDGRSLPSSRAIPGSRTTRNLVGSPVVRLSDDGKEGWLTAHFSSTNSGETKEGFVRGVHEGSYIFWFVKQSDGWKIKKWVCETEVAHDPAYASARAK